MRVAITGLGIISCIGMNVEEWWNNVLSGNTGVKPITRLKNEICKEYSAGEINSDLPSLLPGVSTNHYDRVQLLTSISSKEAWQAARLHEATYCNEQLGVVLGSTYGYIDSATSFYKETLENGPASVSPMHFTNTVMNAAAGKVSIQYKLKGLCATIATGQCSSIDAISYARDAIEAKKCQAILSGGAMTLFELLWMGYFQSGLLVKSDEKSDIIKSRGGLELGEGACIMSVENIDFASKRNQIPIAHVSGCGSTFANIKKGKRTMVDAMSYAIKSAINDACIDIEEIDLVSTGLSSQKALDEIETRTLAEMFNKNKKPKITNVKKMIGECLDASGSFQIAVAVKSIENQIAPPFFNNGTNKIYQEFECAKDAVSQKIKNVLVTSISSAGQCSAVIVSKPD